MDELLQAAGSEDSVGLPIAVQIATLPFKEELCLRLMQEVESAVGYNKC
jgi:Asp-tRNA(Asn)/Glu-tRNA(Gln) amidotransferase A subunit family amidase